MGSIDSAREAADYDELVIILQTMDAEELQVVDDGSLPNWGPRRHPPPVSAQQSLLSWDSQGLESREAWLFYINGQPQLALRDDNHTLDA